MAKSQKVFKRSSVLKIINKQGLFLSPFFYQIVHNLSCRTVLFPEDLFNAIWIVGKTRRCNETWIFVPIQQAYWENWKKIILLCVRFILNWKQKFCWQRPAIFSLYTQAKIQMLTTSCRILTLIHPSFLKPLGLYKDETLSKLSSDI